MKAEYIDHMGDDLRVVNAARVSFNKESEWDIKADEAKFAAHVSKLRKYGRTSGIIPPEHSQAKVLNEKDQKLLKYLASHGHWTPFSHPQVTMREKVPIFVARQRFKHMVGFTYNEVSRRYVDDDPEFFIPDEWRGRPTGSVKQGSEGTIELDDFSADEDYPTFSLQEILDDQLRDLKLLYKRMIEVGVAPEQARMVLPQSMYTEYYVTGSLYAWANAYKQRIDAHAQKEIQDLAKQWGEILEPLFPVSWKELTNA